MSIISRTNNLQLTTYGTNNTQEFLNDITKDNLQLDTVIQKNIEDINALKIETTSLDARVETVEDTVSTFTEEIQKDIKDFTDTVNENIADFETKVSTSITKFDVRLTKNEEDIARLKPENIADLENRVSLAETQIKNNSELIQGLTTRLEDDEDNLAQHALRLDNLDKTVEKNRIDISDLNLSFAEYQETMEERLSDDEATIAALESEYQRLGREVQSLQSAVEGTQVSIQTNANNIQTLAGQISDLQSRMTETESKVINLDQRVKVLEEKG